MKNSIIALAVTAVFASCSNNPKVEEVTTAKIPSADTAGLAQFQNWQTQQEMINTNGMYGGINEFDEGQASSNVRYIDEAPVVRTRSRSTAARSTASRSRSVSNRSYGGSRSSGQTQSVPARRRGWSKAAKGTVIGAGSGAVVGAIVSKKKGKGAIIGGLLGAGAGYVIGRAGDKRDGRY
jgi:hypothetical protein